MKEVVSMYQTLIKEWNKKPLDLEKVGKLLSLMKVSRALVANCYSAIFGLMRNPFVLEDVTSFSCVLADDFDQVFLPTDVFE